MLRMMSCVVTLGVAFLLVNQGGCSAATNGGGVPSAGAPGALAAGAVSSSAGSVSGGASSSIGGASSSIGGAPPLAGGSMGFGGANPAGGAGQTGGTGPASGGSAGARGGSPGVSGGGAGVSGGGAGGAGASMGGAQGAGGSGLGGTTNSLGTISGSPAIAALLALTKNCSTANQIPNSHTYKLDSGSTTSICSLKGGAGNAGGAIYYTADMDIDCDGMMSTHCPGTGKDMDCCYQDQTSFHGPNNPQLTSENTPYVVIPQDVKFPGLDTNKGGSIIAVIYNNQLEFAVFGDTGPTDIIGEASVRTANGLSIPPSPASGGVSGGVTYVAFVGAGTQPADMENLTQIQTLGAQLTQALLKNNP